MTNSPKLNDIKGRTPVPAVQPGSSTWEPLTLKPIFLAQLSAPDLNPQLRDRSKRRFLWQEDSAEVSVLQYSKDGYCFGGDILSLSAARDVWKALKEIGWVCKIRKTPAERLGGIAVRNEINRIQKGSDND